MMGNKKANSYIASRYVSLVIHKFFEILQDWIDFHLFQHLFLWLWFWSEPLYGTELQPRRHGGYRVPLSNLIFVRMEQAGNLGSLSTTVSPTSAQSTILPASAQDFQSLPLLPSWENNGRKRVYVFSHQFPKKRKVRTKEKRRGRSLALLHPLLRFPWPQRQNNTASLETQGHKMACPGSLYPYPPQNPSEGPQWPLHSRGAWDGGKELAQITQCELEGASSWRSPHSTIHVEDIPAEEKYKKGTTLSRVGQKRVCFHGPLESRWGFKPYVFFVFNLTPAAFFPMVHSGYPKILFFFF